MASRSGTVTPFSQTNALNRSMQVQWNSLRKININNPAVLEQPNTGHEPPIEAVQADQSLPPPDSELSKSRKRKPPSIREEGPQKRLKSSVHSKSAESSSPKKDYSPPTTRLSDLGGMQACVEKMLELVAMPLCHPEVYTHTGVQPPRGVLLHGPPGCGKTLLANAIAGELQVPFISVSAPSIVSGMSGESEKTLRETFEEAKGLAPCLLFIDEIDAITPKRESAQREMERRIVAQFLTCMDDLAWDKTNNKPVVIIGATNRPDSLDTALRRAGRFDHEISMNVPDEEARAQILRVLCAKLRLAGDFDFPSLAKQTPGYVGADLAALTGAAGVIAVKRIFQEIAEGKLALPPTSRTESVDQMAVDVQLEALSTQNDPGTTLPSFLPPNSIAHFLLAHPNPLTEEQLEPIYVTYADFLAALPTVQPSSKREGFATIPNVTWADVGALHGIRDELHMSIIEPIKRPELFKKVGIDAPSGVLLWGPPGCGKTLLAKAVAHESRANFISVKGPELLNKYVGESERAVRQVFSRARASTPCIIFFDELDALVPRRDEALSESSARVVNTLLTELDGLDSRKGVHVIAATNRPDMIDPAMCRPGRLDKLLFVDLPNADERVDILRALARKLPLRDEETARLAGEIVKSRCDGFSGADIAALVREVGVLALRRSLAFLCHVVDGQAMGDAIDVKVGVEDLEKALETVGPSVSPAQRRKYEALRKRLGAVIPTMRVPEERVEGSEA